MKLLISSMLSIVVVMFAAGAASAGGWAVTTLDEVPTPTANQTVDVGFTIRQHGVTPVNPDGEVGIVLRADNGSELFFPAEPTGPAGHYVAEVNFPEAGSWTWAVRQGWFAEQILGPIEVASGPARTAEASGYRWPGLVRFGLPVLALLFGAAAVVDLVSARGRRGLAA